MELYFISLVLFLVSMVGSPGPANMIMLASGLKFGFKRSMPFVFGVIISKQFIIWPISLGVINISNISSTVHEVMKYAAAAYIFFLAIKMYNTKITSASLENEPPSFLQGLIVHPLNPKAWLMIATASASFIPVTLTEMEAVLILAPTFFIIQATLHPIWCFFGSWIAKKISDTIYERLFVLAIMFLTFFSVVLIVVNG